MTDVYSVFLSRLLYQYKNSPVILKMVSTLSDMLQDTFDAGDFVLSHLDISAADNDETEDEILDFLGELIGVYRPLSQEDNIFTLRELGEVDESGGGYCLIDDTDATVELGGHLTTLTGLSSVGDPGATVTNGYFKNLIIQKGLSIRKKMTPEILYNYLLQFGSRCIIDDDTSHTVIIDPLSYPDLDEFEKNYVLTKGFKPAGISVSFSSQLRREDSI